MPITLKGYFVLPSSRTFSAALAATGAIFLATACGHQGKDAPAADAAAASASSVTSDASASSDSPGASASAAASVSASPSTSASASASAKPSGSAKPAPSGSRSAAGSGTGTAQAAPTAHAPNFPVRVDVANATQVITVKASGSYATVTAWAKGSSGWKSVISASGRVGSNGIVDGSTRRQGTYTTPAGTYTITEGFGVESGGTSMPYTRVNSSHWWVEDPQSKFYNQMHTAAGADFPLTETGDRGSEHLINYPTQYAKALVINFNRWPATPGRGAGIFLHVNGKGATAGCVSVPRSTMDRIMAWIQPGAHPRIAIG
ncbi:L,D-peptidoglycan transpeptidase YkuD (ErfK/YbiS/YcfS/YnhG family) [Streptomyces sp. SLBN-118]|uniref:L,D-transpeptidase family protein n=1 Tax=Streptomyces sp. SLBN-118 TaxID=2768454 RepID=UPI00116912A0|nr:L,D-transpeptidase family protein [Streptomyces sp. SLBN-118]TQK52314.1 L,D-peptidoglycan transpeptidase YkuD (ErfK/YbiS/YcfS/YnhG family) [Streptomyces sp. SLBN-118]